MSSSVKRAYEGMFLIDAAEASANWDEIVSAIQTIFSRAKADVINLLKWDERRLCYEIGGSSRGTYVLTYFWADSSAITGIERDVQIHEKILRSLILRADHMTEEEMRNASAAKHTEAPEFRDFDDDGGRFRRPRKPVPSDDDVDVETIEMDEESDE